MSICNCSLAGTAACETCQNRPYNYNKGIGITTTWPTNEAMAEKIADLEGQILSLGVELDLSQDRVKDLEKDLERQGKRQGAEGQCPM
jgi:hypothetical protein